jgi:predicted membrane GTPase involved in stress response
VRARLGHDQTFDLFDKLGATEEQLDFPVVYASALNGFAMLDATEAGDIVLVTGIEQVGIGVTICDPAAPVGLPPLVVDEPTLTMNFQVNTSPLAGKEGKYVTSRQIRERLKKELLSQRRPARRGNRRCRRVPRLRSRRTAPDHPARNMRREGYELAVGARACCSRTSTARSANPTNC